MRAGPDGRRADRSGLDYADQRMGVCGLGWVARGSGIR